MTRTTLILFAILFVFSQNTFAQGCPANIDFEKGDFSNWQCSIGTTTYVGTENKIILENSDPMPSRHEIISAETDANRKDPFGHFPVLCPYGGKYSVKLGNANTGSQAEGLSYTFKVPSTVDTFTFTYFYAVVFEDPGHFDYQQPRFFVTAYDVATGNLINCASYNYISTSGLPGFTRSDMGNDVLYKNWSPVSIQFAGLANRMVRLEFKTADCTQSGHFGYAYVDVGTGCSNLLATAPFCAETNSLILNAPYGFQTYTWYNSDYSDTVGTTQFLTLSPPPATSGVFHVDYIPYPGFGCRDTADAAIEKLPVPDTPSAPPTIFYCQATNAVPLTASQLPGHDLFWYTDSTGGVGAELSPIPQTSAPGITTYYVTQKKLFGCESLRKPIAVTVSKVPVTKFDASSFRECLAGNNFSFTNHSSNLSNAVYNWQFGDDSSSSDSNTVHSFANYGNYTVTLRVLNPPVCFAESHVQVIVVPPPVADFIYPPVICENQTLIDLVDNSSVPQGLSTITKWWWNVMGNITTAQKPAAFIAGGPGSIPVQLVVTTAEGCRSDTNNLPLTIHYRPTAAFSYSTPLCNNETIYFTDNASLRPEASPEIITRWHWQFGSTVNISQQQNPAIGLAPADYDVSLVAETNFGCQSPAVDSIITVHAKPGISLNITDSCILRTLQYQAIDLTNTVDKWYWNFGTGFTEKPPLLKRMYNKEGSYPLTLIGKTIYGCKDTVIRPFIVYDNKAFAGNDTLTAMGQPVQLNAHGGNHVQYQWSPALGLDNAAIENPVATLDIDQLYRLDAMSDKGCDAHSKILIKRFKGPELYIPTGFTPDANGVNDTLRVIPVGIKTFHYFAVYNRWGEQVFYTLNAKKGWDGSFKGRKSEPGTYSAVASAIDYRGTPMLRKVNVVLIR